MKTILAIACGALLAVVLVGAQSSQPRPYKVVFDLTTDNPADQTAVLRFRDPAGGSLVVRLDGLHLVATRQSLLGEWSHITPA